MNTLLTTLDTTRIDDTRIGAVRPLITPALLEEALPVPDDLHDLLVGRVRRLSATARDVLLLASLLSNPTEESLARAIGAGYDEALERGRHAGIVDVIAASVRFTHPLLASAVAESAKAWT